MDRRTSAARRRSPLLAASFKLPSRSESPPLSTLYTICFGPNPETAPALRRSARMTHLCSLKSTHTKNRVWAYLPAGKKPSPAARVSHPLVTPSFFPNQFVFGGGPGALGLHLPAGNQYLFTSGAGSLLASKSRVISRECRSPGHR